MSLENPYSVLYNSEGNELAVSQSQNISSSQPAVLIAGSGSQGVSFLKITDDGSLLVSSSVSPILNITASITASVTVPLTQSILVVGAPTAFLSSANALTTSVEILQSNENRSLATFYIEGNQTFYLGFGTNPTTNLFTIKLNSGTFFELPERYTGSVFAIANSNDPTSKIMITEISY